MVCVWRGVALRNVILVLFPLPKGFLRNNPFSFSLSTLKRLAGQTALYGMSNIVGRLLNYFLVPLHTYLFSQAQYGTVTEFYAYSSFLYVVYTFGMETAYFRFSSKQPEIVPPDDAVKTIPPRIYSTAFFSIASIRGRNSRM